MTCFQIVEEPEGDVSSFASAWGWGASRRVFSRAAMVSMSSSVMEERSSSFFLMASISSSRYGSASLPWGFRKKEVMVLVSVPTNPMPVSIRNTARNLPEVVTG